MELQMNNQSIFVLPELKTLIQALKATGKRNHEIARELEGAQFEVQAKGLKTTGEVLAELEEGAIAANLTCPSCGGTHIRKQGDWHQAILCPTCRGGKVGALGVRAIKEKYGVKTDAELLEKLRKLCGR
jgi:Zn finger protein HypA/HybF involved in hydrogenase expression